MKKTLRIMDKFSEILHNLCINISAMMLVAMIAIVFTRVLLRFGMSSGLQWSEEISVLTMMWIGFFGGSTLFYDKAHVSVTFLTERLSEKARHKVSILYRILTILFLFLLFRYGVEFVISGKRMVFGASGLKKSWSYLSIPAGAIFVFFFETVHLIHEFLPDNASKGEGCKC